VSAKLHMEPDDGYGTKVAYQHHPAWLAEHGYVCLIVDTLDLGELPGEHHGTYSRGMWLLFLDIHYHDRCFLNTGGNPVKIRKLTAAPPSVIAHS
jgi:hypothetical protein